ncbi:cytokine-inducible SH2-containing protein-like [Sipha flava]|uniref:Cytokine-inducible SH2-containing protein-like n=1 Tax=Sipha flava TaxID=143950 RepID=A0A8B8FI76_9HEMI|nr:cytokine-inducible SH2-containing protein-like [Sipha flava]XP_025410409.1 cytokine-inducible SH2-containing protein-like [Sipha flava]XP_025410410.1 cytokine-inducible SH2-containing protein-like [Sipha flava]XP_025410411.1 cytokine-inducible SH2-containing protein-like [Sipha flava]XP_025410412.1 cytokine-inducible SH2-containing protein-like [Sipha flava]
MLNTSCWETERQDSDHNAVVPPVVLQDTDNSLRLQACWIRLWDRWACEQRNLVLYQMHINHALSRERSKLTLAGGRVVSCRRIKQQQQLSSAGTRCRSSMAAAAAVTASITVPAVTAVKAPVSDILVGGPDAVSARDLRVLSTAVDRLRTSGWYYEGADARVSAAGALANMPAGRFCVRDSKHFGHLFTMDVQTGRRGDNRLMSVRFSYADGLFGLDSMPRRAGALRVPKFRCPIELIDYYVRLSRIEAARQMIVYPVWIDQCGQFFSWMNLCRPMIKTDATGFPSLKHTSRLVINRHKRLITITPTSLPNELIEYLLQYPYSL